MNFKKNKILNFFTFSILLCSIFFFSNLSGFEKRILHLTSLNKDLFSDVFMAIGTLDYFKTPTFEKCYIGGVKIDFGKKGAYYTPEKGLNYWQYYFEPVRVGWGIDLMPIGSSQLEGFAQHARKNTTLQKSHEIITKFIHVKPFITEKVENFYNNRLNGFFVIGVHYDPTDNSIPPSVFLDKLHSEILGVLSSYKPESFKLFLATTTPECIQFFETKFPGRVHATSLPIDTPYQLGAKLLVDCLLLSKSHFLLRTSNMTYVASQFNPEIKFKDIK